MNKFLVYIILILSQGITYGQDHDFIDSLKSNSENKIIMFQTNCVGCIVIKKPCKKYIEDGNPWNIYVIWENSKGKYIKKYNNCGSSSTHIIKKWKSDPFVIVESNISKINATKLKYPLSFDQQDSTWYITGVNHYKYYNFSFPTYKIKDIQLMDYAFREVNETDTILVSIDKESQRNQYRYVYNNKTIIKKLLDCLMVTINKESKRLKITTKQ